jgi:hypothetical protein
MDNSQPREWPDIIIWKRRAKVQVTCVIRIPKLNEIRFDEFIWFVPKHPEASLPIWMTSKSHSVLLQDQKPSTCHQPFSRCEKETGVHSASIRPSVTPLFESLAIHASMSAYGASSPDSVMTDTGTTRGYGSAVARSMFQSPMKRHPITFVQQNMNAELHRLVNLWFAGRP